MRRGKLLLCTVLLLCLAASGYPRAGAHTNHTDDPPDGWTIPWRSPYPDDHEYDPLLFFDVDPQSGVPNLALMLAEGREHPVLDRFALQSDLMPIHKITSAGTRFVVPEPAPGYKKLISDHMLGDPNDSEDVGDDSYLMAEYEIEEVFINADGEEFLMGVASTVTIRLYPTISQAQSAWLDRFTAIYSNASNPAVQWGLRHVGAGDAGVWNYTTGSMDFVRSNVLVSVAGSGADVLADTIDAQIMAAMYPDHVAEWESAQDGEEEPPVEPRTPPPAILFPDVTEQMQDYDQVRVSFDPNGAWVRRSPHAYLGETRAYNVVDLEGGYALQTGYGMGAFVATMDLYSGAQYDTLLWPYNEAVWLSNDVIAIVGGYQDAGGNSTHDEALLLDMHCRPLSHQLQFDYGPDLDELYAGIYDTRYTMGHRHHIAGLVYHPDRRQYIAVFHTNAFWDTQDGEYDNSICTVGIAVFNDRDVQLNRFELDGLVFPQFGKYSRCSLRVIQVDDASILLIPRGVQSPYTGDPICINVDDRSYTIWDEEEMQAFLDASPQWEGSFSGRTWEVMGPTEPPFAYSDGMVYLPETGEPAFRVPQGYTLAAWGVEQSGACYGVFHRNAG